MAKQKTKRAAKPKAHKQGRLPGMEIETHLDIEEASDVYLEARNARMELTKAEVEAKGKLLDLMKAHKIEKYEYDGHMVEYTRGVQEDIRVKTVKDKAETNGEAE